MGFIIVVVWIACGYVSMGITRGYFYRTHKRVTTPQDSLGLETLIALAGPLGLLMSFILSGAAEKGLKFDFKKEPGE